MDPAYIALALGILTAVVAILKFVAPKTKTKVDDTLAEVGDDVLKEAQKIKK